MCFFVIFYIPKLWTVQYYRSLHLVYLYCELPYQVRFASSDLAPSYHTPSHNLLFTLLQYKHLTSPLFLPMAKL